MKRRDLFRSSAAFGLVSAIPFADVLANDNNASPPSPLKPPAKGSIPVAFLVSEGAVVIDFCGPWEVFQDVYIPTRRDAPFQLYTVAETTSAIRTSGGMQIVPDYDFKTAPAPKVIVIPAQSGHSDATLDWIRKSAKTSDLTMSVCTGAFLLASTGLLSGKSATTHHASFKSFANSFPDIQLKRGARFVENGNLATAGGLSSGIDLALRVVERYYGHDAAVQTAYYMEYQGQGWLDANANSLYTQERQSTEAHPLCPVCGMEVDPKTSPTLAYKGKTYYFCSDQHKDQFTQSPEVYLKS